MRFVSWRWAARLAVGVLVVGLAAAGWFLWSVMGLSPFENNLRHPAGTATAPLGAPPPAVERGHGPVDVLLVSGLGYGVTPWEIFQSRYDSTYRTVATALPGFGGTAPPPLPGEGSSYGDLPWTRGAARGLAALIRERRMDRPVVVGFFTGGAHVALRLAREAPELVRGVIAVGADAYRPLQSSFGGRTLSYEERIVEIDERWGPWVFGRMRPEYFRANVFPASAYAHDTAVAQALVRESREAPLPTSVQYLAEHMASDVRRILPELTVPVLVLQPELDEEARAANPGLDFLLDTWSGLDTLDHLEIRRVAEARAAVMVDRPDALDQAIRGMVAAGR